MALLATAVNPVTGQIVTQSGSTVATTYGRITSGDVTVSAQADWTTTGLGFTVPATVGSTVAISACALVEWASLNSDYFDIMIIGAASAIVRRASSGTASATTSDKGELSLYPSPSVYVRSSCPFAFVAEATDIVSGNVNVAIYSKGSGGATIYASTSFPLRYHATVHS